MSRLDPPAHYDDERRAIWSEAVTRLTSGGRIFRADPEILNAYVEAVRSHRQASRILGQSDVTIQREDGSYTENPALAIQRRSAEAMARASRALGLSWITARDTPIAETGSPDPIAPLPDQRRWCEEHKRYECRHNRQDGTPCHQYRLVTGLDVCRKHGGKSLDKLRADGRERIADREAARLLYRRDAVPVTDPLSALQALAGRALALEEVIGEKVNELRSIRYETEHGGEQIRGELQILEKAMDRAARLLVDIAKLNIEARLAGVREATARMLEEALSMALQKSGA
ncbi:MAG TPA: phage terminase small subunit P27 family, partial [Streptosporangiaceae bacterium]|nr:phage terminase small subunit P27 family [Streptosporangiaceae bacterium]